VLWQQVLYSCQEFLNLPKVSAWREDVDGVPVGWIPISRIRVSLAKILNGLLDLAGGLLNKSKVLVIVNELACPMEISDIELCELGWVWWVWLTENFASCFQSQMAEP
jgi:hypothetical protein